MWIFRYWYARYWNKEQLQNTLQMCTLCFVENKLQWIGLSTRKSGEQYQLLTVRYQGLQQTCSETYINVFIVLLACRQSSSVVSTTASEINCTVRINNQQLGKRIPSLLDQSHHYPSYCSGNNRGTDFRALVYGVIKSDSFNKGSHILVWNFHSPGASYAHKRNAVNSDVSPNII